MNEQFYYEFLLTVAVLHHFFDFKKIGPKDFIEFLYKEINTCKEIWRVHGAISTLVFILNNFPEEYEKVSKELLDRENVRKTVLQANEKFTNAFSVYLEEI